MRAKPGSEQILQEAVAAYFAVALPKHAFAFHVANEGKRGPKAQRDFKRGGGVAGVPDWMIVFTGRPIFIELKLPHTDLTPAQCAVHERLTLCGAIVKTCRSLEEVIDFLRVTGVPLRGAIA